MSIIDITPSNGRCRSCLEEDHRLLSVDGQRALWISCVSRQAPRSLLKAYNE